MNPCRVVLIDGPYHGNIAIPYDRERNEALTEPPALLTACTMLPVVGQQPTPSWIYEPVDARRRAYRWRPRARV